jgi:hypothetical protein
MFCPRIAVCSRAHAAPAVSGRCVVCSPLDPARARCQKDRVRRPKIAQQRVAAGSRGAICAALCGLFLTAQLLAFAHLAFVEHRTCATHGKLVHRARAAASVKSARPAVGVARPASSAADEDHDHCVCLAPSRERVLHASAGPQASVSVAAGWPHGIDVALAPARAIALLSLAPKNSPPA